MLRRKGGRYNSVVFNSVRFFSSLKKAKIFDSWINSKIVWSTKVFWAIFQLLFQSLHRKNSRFKNDGLAPTEALETCEVGGLFLFLLYDLKIKFFSFYEKGTNNNFMLFLMLSKEYLNYFPICQKFLKFLRWNCKDKKKIILKIIHTPCPNENSRANIFPKNIPYISPSDCIFPCAQIKANITMFLLNSTLAKRSADLDTVYLTKNCKISIVSRIARNSFFQLEKKKSHQIIKNYTFAKKIH